MTGLTWIPGRRGAGRAVVALLGLVAAAVALPPAEVRAADVAFTDAQATATWGEGLAFSVRMDARAEVDRLELRIRFPDTLGPVVVPVDVPAGDGPQRITGEWDLDRDGHLVPNTRLTGQWVAFGADGTSAASEPVAVRYTDTRLDWQTVRGDVVRVHWTEGGEAFGRQALRIGEDAVRETAALLGVEEREPIDFFIYHDQAAFREALGPGTRENVGGQAHSDIRTLFALISAGEIDDPWVRIVVPHELVHLVFDTTVDNAYRFPPRWLNEGLAVYLSQGYDAGDRGEVERAARGGDLLPLTALTGQFPTTFDGFSLAYAESVSAVDFLVRRHSRDGLVALVRQYRDGLSDEDAFQRALGESFSAFQDAWFSDLGISAPEPHGPVAAAPGPVPPGWDTPVATAAPVRTQGSTSASPEGSTPAAPTAAPTPAAATPAPGAPTQPTANAGPDLTAVLLGVLVVAGAVVGGFVLGRPAGRRP